jgi:N utilization substance protein A
MKGLNLIESFADFKEFKNIDRETITNILAEMFKAMIVKRWGAEDGFDIIINAERGDLEIWRTRQVVPDGELDDEVAEIEVSMAQKIVDDLEVGEELIEEIKRSIAEEGREIKQEEIKFRVMKEASFIENDYKLLDQGF